MRILLIALCGLVVGALLWTRSVTSVGLPRMTWVVTAHQLGPVGYRDPAGGVSPDGHWLAYSEGRFLRVRSVTGGPIIEFLPGRAQIRNLLWSPDSRTIVADGDTPQGGWAVYDLASTTRRPLWPNRSDASDVRQLAWSADGRTLAGLVNGRDGVEVWSISADGATAHSMRPDRRVAFPAWTPRGDVACIATVNGRSRVTIPCGGPALSAQPDLDAYGPLAFSPDGATAYVSLANTSGTVDLWAVPTSKGRARQLSQFSRDSYAPTVAADGSVVFKLQSYRTTVALADAAGGPSRPLTTFQSETPSWDPTGTWIGITYGTWRRVPDDAKYPDIAQDAGIIGADPARPASAPSAIVQDSTSEDQALCWSPNGRWIAFHSHKDQSDDIWLRRATGDPQARRITMFGRGAEAGWPRWSRDGRWVVFTAAGRRTHRPAMYIVGIDQESGEVSSPPREIGVSGLEVEVFHAEWADAGREVAAVGKEGPGQQVIFTVDRDGGAARVIHRFASEHDQPGLGVSPDGREVAFIAPASDGFFQIFRMPLVGGPLVQVTRDASNKTQPAWSPEGGRIAFTVWSYDAQFWRIDLR
jgi:Tol biopolymer transport system component